jgi:hypothetical protein
MFQRCESEPVKNTRRLGFAAFEAGANVMLPVFWTQNTECDAR